MPSSWFLWSTQFIIIAIPDSWRFTSLHFDFIFGCQYSKIWFYYIYWCLKSYGKNCALWICLNAPKSISTFRLNIFYLFVYFSAHKKIYWCQRWNKTEKSHNISAFIEIIIFALFFFYFISHHICDKRVKFLCFIFDIFF